MNYRAVSGTVEQTNAYMEILKVDPLFKGIIFKIDEAGGHAFKKNACASKARVGALAFRGRH